MKGYRKILVIRTDRIGDVLLSTPVIEALRRQFPKSHIGFMCRPYTADIVRGNPYLDEVIVYDKYGKHKGPVASWRFARELGRKGFDLALILHPTNRVHLISFLAGIRDRVGYDKKLSFLLTKKIADEKFKGEKHELDYNFDILKLIGVQKASENIIMPVSVEARNEASRILKAEGISQADKLVAMHPAASCRSKMWPAKRFIETANQLHKAYNIKLLLISSEKDRRLLDKMLLRLRPQTKILSGLGLKVLAAILKQCRLLISNDSGPVHIAAAVGTPAVVIFGRSQKGLGPKRWGPVGRKNRILHKPPDCLECLAHKCKNNFKCLEAVNVEDVINAAREITEDFNS